MKPSPVIHNKVIKKSIPTPATESKTKKCSTMTVTKLDDTYEKSDRQILLNYCPINCSPVNGPKRNKKTSNILEKYKQTKLESLTQNINSLEDEKKIVKTSLKKQINIEQESKIFKFIKL